MRLSNVLLALTAAAANAERPADVSMCDYYTKTLLGKENTPENQALLVTLLVHTVILGNYTTPNVGIAVPGLLAPAVVNGENVNLLPYFSGEYATTNRGDPQGVSINFLDGGGPAPLLHNKPADDETSNQYFLVTHLHQYFGTLIGCTYQGYPAFPAYAGAASMYQVHKFMDLNFAQNKYFIDQHVLAAESLGFSAADGKVFGDHLYDVFAVRCGPPTSIVKTQGPQLQSTCLTSDCPQAEDSECDLYPAVTPSSPAGSSAAASKEQCNEEQCRQHLEL
ncbi:uncharacterized protein TrAFT101_004472 [Trichoderma asperellum]|uniref:Heme haloperoxidase family profile domain-containing protein n=1 Tax=Trichoderma asperellum (strain ATCC 204424 / CBS 433.97 / NBRC 101777) TaxID=1042311 RepID=A0A2T3ZMM2_TRIA4|nr:hypothetical protein M441DRAFT_85219 [Trichoderma asperellum CBS 433.97]PTB46053.1 hypothetical protein M441DRAFT_85219 [Trichoderma asperellum CBS 433.97]UKZ88733.1 hypothetical protein TrAFT101_004472 [Trichoderma asperellum]